MAIVATNILIGYGTLKRFALQMVRAATLLFVVLAPLCARAEFRADIEDFLSNHCYDCHGLGEAEGGLDLEKLGANLNDPASFGKWVDVFDRVSAGEMPPAKRKRPKGEEQAGFLKQLRPALDEAHAKKKGTVLRRLNRREYENTLNDLFGTNLRLAERLPEDGRSHEFDNVGKALGLSMVHLRRYLEVADDVIEHSVVKTIAKPERKVIRASYADTRGAEKFLGKNWLKLKDGAVMIPQAWGYPTGMLREAHTEVPGFYKVRVKGYAYQSDKPITFAIGATTFARGLERPTFSYHEFPPGQPTTVEIEVWIEKNYMIEITPYGIYDEGYLIKKNGLENYRGPGLAIHHVEVEGPLVKEFPGRGHKLLFEGLNRREVLPRNPKEREKSWYKPRFELVLVDENKDIGAALMRIASEAFRRPVDPDMVEPYRTLYQAERAKGGTVEDSLRTAVTAIFCSPDFLYLREKPGPLDDDALANRLAYFLTRTAPDAQLRSLAESGKLTGDKTALRSQVDRLLEHKHFNRFVSDFTDAWLNLREIDFTAPDRTLYPEFDPFLRFSIVQETRSFFGELVRSNLSVTNVVKSEFAMLNNRLADHYDLPGVSGPVIRRIALPKDSIRGGFLTQASILKVSANGTNTSPVVRGVWVLDRLLNQPPKPPPPGTPGVEPDIRGATTLRELLDKHRNSSSCRSCHQRIDPPGFALESFNAIGGFRSYFRSLGEGERVVKTVGTRKVQYRVGPPVDSTGTFPDGTQFAGVIEFRDHLAKQEDQLARAFLEKLLTFGTGRELGFSDRPEVGRLVQASARNRHGIRDLIHLAISSEIFRNK